MFALVVSFLYPDLERQRDWWFANCCIPTSCRGCPTRAGDQGRQRNGVLKQTKIKCSIYSWNILLRIIHALTHGNIVYIVGSSPITCLLLFHFISFRLFQEPTVRSYKCALLPAQWVSEWVSEWVREGGRKRGREEGREGGVCGVSRVGGWGSERVINPILIVSSLRIGCLSKKWSSCYESDVLSRRPDVLSRNRTCGECIHMITIFTPAVERCRKPGCRQIPASGHLSKEQVTCLYGRNIAATMTINYILRAAC